MNNGDLARNIDSAMRSNEIEWHVFTEEEKAFFARVKSGEISLKQALKMVLSEAKKSVREG